MKYTSFEKENNSHENNDSTNVDKEGRKSVYSNLLDIDTTNFTIEQKIAIYTIMIMETMLDENQKANTEEEIFLEFIKETINVPESKYRKFENTLKENGFDHIFVVLNTLDDYQKDMFMSMLNVMVVLSGNYEERSAFVNNISEKIGLTEKEINKNVKKVNDKLKALNQNNQEFSESLNEGKTTANTKQNNISGEELARQVIFLQKLAERENWELFESIEIKCSECKKIFSIGRGGINFETINFCESITPLGLPGKRICDINEKCSCNSCGNSNFEIINNKLNIIDVLQKAVDSVQEIWPCKENISEGFVDIESREIINNLSLNFPFQSANSISLVWGKIEDYWDKSSGMQLPDEFNTVTSKDNKEHLINALYFISNWNDKRNCKTVLLKDSNETYWYSIIFF